jgi:AraC-like DNA-binding protein
MKKYEINFEDKIYFRYINRHLFEETYVTDIGFEQCTADKPPIRFYHTDRIALHLVISGAGILRVQKTNYNISRDTLFITPLNLDVEYRPNPALPWKYFWICFCGSKATALCRRMGLTAENPVYKTSSTEQILQDLKAILNETDLFESGIDLSAISHLFNIVKTVAKERNLTEDQKKDKKQHYVQFVLNYVANNYNNKDAINLNTIANHLFLNPIYINRVFKESLGIPIYRYVINYRLHKAQELIESTNLSIKEISEAVGYADQLAFSKQFRKHYNTPPTTFNIYDK